MRGRLTLEFAAKVARKVLLDHAPSWHVPVAVIVPAPLVDSSAIRGCGYDIVSDAAWARAAFRTDTDPTLRVVVTPEYLDVDHDTLADRFRHEFGFGLVG